MNRAETVAKTKKAVAEVLRRQGYVSAVDVLMQMGILEKKAYEDWRTGRVPYLEKVVQGNLSKISVVMKAMRARCRELGLNERLTDYRRWGKGSKQRLRFSKSGAPSIERAYATHHVSKRLAKENPERKAEKSEPSLQPAPVPARPARPIEMDPVRLEQLARSKWDEHVELRSELKFAPSEKAVDRLFHQFHEEVSQQVDCTTCARCCEVMSPSLTKNDVRRLAEYLGISRAQVRERYLHQEEGQWVMASKPCPFLRDRKCSIYEIRPRACRDFPHLHKRRMADRLWSVIDNASVCPIVYEVVERVREAYGKKS